jgi:hypothetical protein
MTAIITSLITVVGILAAAWLGSTLSKRVSQEQILFSRAHERREEILTTLYGLILEVRDGHWTVTIHALPSFILDEEDKERLMNSHRHLHQKIEELTNYYRMNAIWLYPELCIQIEHVIKLFKEQEEHLFWNLTGRDFAVASDETDDQRERRELEEQEQAQEWHKSTGNPAIKTLESEFRTVLGVFEREDTGPTHRRLRFWKRAKSR